MNFARRCAWIAAVAAPGLGITVAAGAGIAAPASPRHRPITPVSKAPVSRVPASSAVAPKRLPPIVARFNGKVITRDELDAELENYQEGAAARQILANLILKQLVHDRAARLGILPTPAQFEKAYNEANMAAQGRLPQLLTSHHLTRAQFQQQYLEPKIELMNLARYGVTVTDADIRSYFEQNKQQWIQPEMLKLYRIHTATRDAANAARAALTMGATWDDTLKKYSDDPAYYKDHEGYYGAVIRETLPKEVQDAIGTLKAGQYSEPIQVKEEGANPGWTIWRVGEIIPGKPPSLEDHRAEIRERVYQAKSKPDVEILRDVIRSTKISDLPQGYEQLFAPLLQPQQMMPPPRGGMPQPGMAPPPGGNGPPPGIRPGGPPGGGPGAPPPPPPPGIR